MAQKRQREVTDTLPNKVFKLTEEVDDNFVDRSSLSDDVTCSHEYDSVLETYIGID